jgi:hypothetical protein
MVAVVAEPVLTATDVAKHLPGSRTGFGVASPRLGGENL